MSTIAISIDQVRRVLIECGLAGEARVHPLYERYGNTRPCLAIEVDAFGQACMFAAAWRALAPQMLHDVEDVYDAINIARYVDTQPETTFIIYFPSVRVRG